MALSLEEFIRRLRLHLLPPFFVKIRHYEPLANRGRQERLARARVLLDVAPVPTEDAPREPAGCPFARTAARPRCSWSR
jgi:Putative transposase